MEVYNNVKDILRQRIIMSTIYQKCLSSFTTKDVYLHCFFTFFTLSIIRPPFSIYVNTIFCLQWQHIVVPLLSSTETGSSLNKLHLMKLCKSNESHLPTQSSWNSSEIYILMSIFLTPQINMLWFRSILQIEVETY